MNSLERLFKRYNYMNLMGFIVLSAVLMAFLYLNTRFQIQKEISNLQEEFEKEVDHIDTFLKQISDNILSLRYYFENNLAYISLQNHPKNILFSHIADSPDKRYFHLDEASNFIGKEMVGSVTGAGSFQNRENAFYSADITFDFLNSRIGHFRPEYGRTGCGYGEQDQRKCNADFRDGTDIFRFVLRCGQSKRIHGKNCIRFDSAVCCGSENHPLDQRDRSDTPQCCIRIVKIRKGFI